MSEPFITEIKIVGFNFAPRGWAFCDGQILPISQNQSLFELLGTTYGGDGRTSFALPDLRGRTPIHEGQGHSQGQKDGKETHTLTMAEMPRHTHTARGSGDTASVATVTGGDTDVAATAGTPVYHAPGANLTTLNPASISNFGGGQAHENMQPWLALNFCIALQGLFPSRN